MKQNISHKSVPISARVLNPVAKYYYQCTEETQRAIRNLSTVLLFTVIVCGAILAASICKFCFGGNYYLFIPIFIMTASFYYLIDKPIVFSSSKFNKKTIKWIRIFIALILGLFNSFLIDSFYFQDDITAARNLEIEGKRSIIVADFEKRESLLNTEKTELIGQINTINALLSIRLDSLNNEAKGTGGSRVRGVGSVWNRMNESYKKDSIAKSKEIAYLENEIAQRNKTLAENKAEMQEAIEKLPNKVSAGINKNMELLHEIIFLEGNITNISMAILILIISMLFELAPLISKSFYDTSEYFERCASQKDIKDKESIVDKNKEINIIATRILLEQKREEKQLIRQDVKFSLLDVVEHNKEILEIAAAERDRLEKIDKELKRRYPQDYEIYLKPVMETSYTNIHNAVMVAISKG